MGVVSGIVMPFQFGTNWSRFSDLTADIVGPLMAYEGLTAFFLEAGFLGVLLFGRERVPRVDAFWRRGHGRGRHAVLDVLDPRRQQLDADAHRPFHRRGRFFPEDWIAVIFNPSFPYRFAHTVTAFYITTAFVVAGVAAYHLRAGRFREEGTTMLKMAFGLLTLLVPLQIVLGDLHGLNTREHQPVKIAAMEANWETQARMPLLLFAWPDERAEPNRFEVGIPVLGSIILTHDATASCRA